MFVYSSHDQNGNQSSDYHQYLLLFMFSVHKQYVMGGFFYMYNSIAADSKTCRLFRSRTAAEWKQHCLWRKWVRTGISAFLHPYRILRWRPQSSLVGCVFLGCEDGQGENLVVTVDEQANTGLGKAVAHWSMRKVPGSVLGVSGRSTCLKLESYCQSSNRPMF